MICLILQSGALLLARGLAQNETLQIIDLSANNLQSAGTKHILGALSNHPRLTWLDLHANNIHDDAIPYIEQFVSKSQTIKSLNIRANFLTDSSAQLLAGTMMSLAAAYTLNGSVL